MTRLLWYWGKYLALLIVALTLVFVVLGAIFNHQDFPSSAMSLDWFRSGYGTPSQEILSSLQGTLPVWDGESWSWPRLESQLETIVITMSWAEPNSRNWWEEQQTLSLTLVGNNPLYVSSSVIPNSMHVYDWTEAEKSAFLGNFFNHLDPNLWHRIRNVTLSYYWRPEVTPQLLQMVQSQGYSSLNISMAGTSSKQSWHWERSGLGSFTLQSFSEFVWISTRGYYDDPGLGYIGLGWHQTNNRHNNDAPERISYFSVATDSSGFELQNEGDFPTAVQSYFDHWGRQES